MSITYKRRDLSQSKSGRREVTFSFGQAQLLQMLSSWRSELVAVRGSKRAFSQPCEYRDIRHAAHF